MDIRELVLEALRTLEVDQAGLAKRLGRSQATVSRWVSGDATPDYESCLRLARIVGMPARRVLEVARLDTTLVPDDTPESQPPLEPRLAMFLAEIETGWRTMDQQAREMAERGTRALFRVEDVRRSRRVTNSDEGFDKSNEYDQPFDERPVWMRHPAEQPARFPPVKRVQRTVTPAPVTRETLTPAGVAR